MAINGKEQMAKTAKEILEKVGLNKLPITIQQFLVAELVKEVLEERTKSKSQSTVGWLTRGTAGLFGARGLVTSVIGKSTEDLNLKEQALQKQCEELVTWINQIKGYKELSDSEKVKFIEIKRAKTMSEVELTKTIESTIAIRIKQKKELDELAGFNELTEKTKEAFREDMTRTDLDAHKYIISRARETIGRQQAEQLLPSTIGKLNNFDILHPKIQEAWKKEIKEALTKQMLASPENVELRKAETNSLLEKLQNNIKIIEEVKNTKAYQAINEDLKNIPKDPTEGELRPLYALFDLIEARTKAKEKFLRVPYQSSLTPTEKELYLEKLHEVYLKSPDLDTTEVEKITTEIKNVGEKRIEKTAKEKSPTIPDYDEAVVLEKAKARLTENGLLALPNEIQNSYVRKLANALKYRSTANALWLKDLRGASDFALTDQENKIINECKQLSGWINNFPLKDRLSSSEQEAFINRVYQLNNPAPGTTPIESIQKIEDDRNKLVIDRIKTDPAVQEKINNILKELGNQNEFSPHMAIIYKEFKEKVEKAILDQALSIDKPPSIALEKITKQIKTTIELDKEGRLKSLYNDWKDSGDRFILYALDLINFTTESGDTYKKRAEDIMKGYITRMPNYKTEFPDEYSAFLKEIRGLEESAELAVYNKDNAKFDKKQHEAALINIQGKINSHAHFNSIQHINNLPEAKQDEIKNKIQALENDRLKFEKDYKVDIFDAASSGLQNLVDFSTQTAKKNELLSNYNKIRKEISTSIRDQIKKNIMEKKTLSDLTKLSDKDAKEMVDTEIDLQLLNAGAWQHVSDTLITENGEEESLKSLRTKYKRGELTSSENKPDLTALVNKATMKITAITKKIELFEKYEVTPPFDSYRKFDKAIKNKYIEVILKSTEQEKKMAEELMTSLNYEPFRKRFSAVLTADEAREVIKEKIRINKKQEELKGLEASAREENLPTVQQKLKELFIENLKFEATNYQDSFLKELDEQMGVEEKINMAEEIAKLEPTLWEQIYYNFYYNRTMWGALKGGSIGAIAGSMMPIIGTIAGGVAGAIAGAISPKTAEIPQQLVENYKPKLLVTAKKILLFPFTEFSSAYTEYVDGKNKMSNGFRMAAIVSFTLGIIVASVFTGGIGVFAIIGAVYLGAAVSKGIKRGAKIYSKWTTGVEDTEQYLFSQKTQELLGGPENASKISAYFENKVKELDAKIDSMDRDINKTKDNQYNPELGKARDIVVSELNTLKEDFEKIKKIKNPETAKDLLKIHIKNEYKKLKIQYLLSNSSERESIKNTMQEFLKLNQIVTNPTADTIKVSPTPENIPTSSIIHASMDNKHSAEKHKALKKTLSFSAQSNSPKKQPTIQVPEPKKPSHTPNNSGPK